MRSLVTWGVLIALLCGCARSPYEGYKSVGDNVHIKLLALGEGEALPADSDSVYMRIRMGWQGADVGGLYSTDAAFLVRDLRNGAFVPALQRIRVGDSLSVIAPATGWPWAVLLAHTEDQPPDTGTVRMELSLRALRTPAMVKAERERYRRNDPKGYEDRLIAAYVAQQVHSYTRWGTSEVHYFITGTPSDTNRIVVGDQVTIAYYGVRLEDGRTFDDTQRNGASFTFIYGERDQVMNGLEVAVLLLREGQQGRFIFPSEQAFGAKGIPGILDPYMPVEYTVRLEKVERAKSL